MMMMMALIKRGQHPLSQQPQQNNPHPETVLPVQSPAVEGVARVAMGSEQSSSQPAWVQTVLQGAGNMVNTLLATPKSSASEVGTQQQPAPPELDDPFLQSLVWDEDSVASGVVPDRRGTPRPIRRQEDTSLLADAKAEAEYIKEQAREAGFQEGLRQAQQTIESVWVLLDNLQTAHQQALLNSVEQIVPIAIEIAEKIIKTEVACDKTLLIALAKDLLTKVDRTQKQVIFKVNPSEASFFRAEVEQSPVWRSNEREIVVEEDATVAQGSCVLETAGGQIDANFNTQLKTVRKLLGLPEKAPTADNPLPALDDDDDANWGFRS